MNEQNNEKWLDELISQTINTTKPEFDAEQWKQKYPEEFQLLKSRAEQKPLSIQPSLWMTVLHSRLAKLAAAAVIIIAIGLLRFNQSPHKQESVQIAKKSKSPAEMLTVAALNMAFRRGGIEAVEKQCEQVIDKLGPPPAMITVKELLAEFNGT